MMKLERNICPVCDATMRLSPRSDEHLAWWECLRCGLEEHQAQEDPGKRNAIEKARRLVAGE